VTRSPIACTPATRRPPSRVTSPAPAAAATRRPSSGGSRSDGRANRTGASPLVNVTRRSPESHSAVLAPSAYRSRSPTGVSSSTRHDRGPATNARIRVVSPSSATTRPVRGTSGSPSPARASASPR
jgi:hypothetical protein